MAYRRYGGYGYGPQPQPGYDPYRKTPDWASAIRELLRNMQMMKQIKGEREERKLERDQRAKEFGLQKLKTNIQLQDVAAKRRDRELLPRIREREAAQREEWIGQLPEAEQPYARLKIRPPTTPKPSKPTTFELKKAYWDRRLENKEATQEEYDTAVWGVKAKPTQEETLRKGINPRQANTNWLSNLHKNADIDGIIKTAKKAKARPIVHGVRADMPFKYQLAVLNKQDRIETPEDLDVITRYDAMFRVFQERLLGGDIKSFKEFMTSEDTRDLRRDTNFDKGQIKSWYDIYRKY